MSMAQHEAPCAVHLDESRCVRPVNQALVGVLEPLVQASARLFSRLKRLVNSALRVTSCVSSTMLSSCDARSASISETWFRNGQFCRVRVAS